MSFVRGLIGGFARARWHQRAGAWPHRAALEAWQEQRVLRHLTWVAQHAPFYRERFGAAPTIAAWRAMAPVVKSQLIEHFDTAVTVPLSRARAYEVAQAAYQSRDFDETINGLTVGLSSGTSGTPGLFVASAWERGCWAGTALARALPFPRRLPLHIALALRANSRLYESLNVGVVKFSYLDLHAERSAHVARLTHTPPDILVGPPSVLADLVHAGVRVRPQRVVSVAEPLTPDVETLLREAFACDVVQLYQATEGFIAAPCRAGQLHVNEDIMVMHREYLDDDGVRFVPVITDFTRRSQPIIRYRLTDVLHEQRRPCACGSPFLALSRIEGRVDDVWRLAGARGDVVTVYPDQVSLAIASTAGLAMRDFVATCTSPHTAHIVMEWADGVDPAAHAQHVIHAVEALAHQRGAAGLRVSITAERIVRSDRKHRRVRNEHTHSAAAQALRNSAEQ